MAERYGQFRDRANGVAPFFSVPPEPSGLYLPLHLFLLFFRLPIIIALLGTYFLILQWLPIGSLGKKAILWLVVGTPGLWWVDLQMDAIKKGTIGSHSSLFPQPGSIIAASFTSPLDVIYLAVIFDPIFTASYPSTKLVRPISLLSALLRSFSLPEESPADLDNMMDLSDLVASNQNRYIVVFPEGTTTNGRGILRFTPSLLGASPKTKIYPTSLRYTPADITTPVPQSYLTFIWNLLSRPTHSLRVRIAQAVSMLPAPERGYATNLLDSLHDDSASGSDIITSDDDRTMTVEERKLLDKIGETLARLGRNKRVAFNVKDKIEWWRVTQKYATHRS